MKKVLMIMLAALAVWPAGAKSIEKYHEEIQELAVNDNIASPEVPKKLTVQVERYMADLATRLRRAGYAADTQERDGLVVTVVIPASELFEPNDTLVAPFAVSRLMPLSKYLTVPDKYKVLVTVHSDDTGSEEYLNALTTARADALVEWFGRQGVQTAQLVPYGMGYDEPESVEPSRAGRAKNRRVEIYFVPGPAMLEAMKAGRPI